MSAFLGTERLAAESVGADANVDTIKHIDTVLFIMVEPIIAHLESSNVHEASIQTFSISARVKRDHAAIPPNSTFAAEHPLS